jgi:hypothetical protein
MDFKKGQIYKNGKAKFEILETGEKLKVKITKHGKSDSSIMWMHAEQFRGTTKIHG